MKKKSLILITVSLAITLTVAAVGVAFAWYTESSDADNQIELNADGYLVVYFEENECTLDAIKPAVARKGAVNEGIADFNVLEVGENVVEAAAVVKNEDAMFRYINESNQQSNRADIEFSCEAYMVFPDGTKQEISLKYDLSVEIDMTWVYLDHEEGESGSDGAGGTYSIKMDDWQTPSKTKFTLENSADVTMTTTLYFRQVDDLCDPLIMSAEKIQVLIKAVAVPEVDEATA